MSTAEPLFPTLEDAVARQLLQLRSNIHRLLTLVGDERPCMGVDCEATVFFVKHKNGRTQVYDPDGTPHWATCKNPHDFKKRRPDA